MTLPENNTREDIRDKAREFLIRQVEVKLRTIPSTKFPSGARHVGFILDVNENKILFHDTFVDKRIDIFLSEIASPADIWEKEND